jgi:hypothetical protein
LADVCALLHTALQADMVLVMDQDRLYNQLSTQLKVCGLTD